MVAAVLEEIKRQGVEAGLLLDTLTVMLEV
jgi:hypothetical protein